MNTEVSEVPDALEMVGWARVAQHIRDPQNLLVYLLFSAWAKFMGVAQYLPSITVG